MFIKERKPISQTQYHSLGFILFSLLPFLFVLNTFALLLQCRYSLIIEHSKLRYFCRNNIYPMLKGSIVDMKIILNISIKMSQIKQKLKSQPKNSELLIRQLLALKSLQESQLNLLKKKYKDLKENQSSLFPNFVLSNFEVPLLYTSENGSADHFPVLALAKPLQNKSQIEVSSDWSLELPGWLSPLSFKVRDKCGLYLKTTEEDPPSLQGLTQHLENVSRESSEQEPTLDLKPLPHLGDKNGMLLSPLDSISNPKFIINFSKDSFW